MKAIVNFLLTAAIWMITSGVYAQDQASEKTKTPRWVSDKGFWQIESNIHTPNKNIIYFYNNDQVLIYKESLDGIKINLKKNSVKLRLRKALETAAAAWNRDSLLPGDRQLISALFRK